MSQREDIGTPPSPQRDTLSEMLGDMIRSRTQTVTTGTATLMHQMPLTPAQREAYIAAAREKYSNAPPDPTLPEAQQEKQKQPQPQPQPQPATLTASPWVVEERASALDDQGHTPQQAQDVVKLQAFGLERHATSEVRDDAIAIADLFLQEGVEPDVGRSILKHVELAVQNGGPGVSEEQMDRAFLTLNDAAAESVVNYLNDLADRFPALRVISSLRSSGLLGNPAFLQQVADHIASR